MLAAAVLAVALAGLAYGADIGAESDIFPRFPCIQPNVEFWTNIHRITAFSTTAAGWISFTTSSSWLIPISPAVVRLTESV